MSRQPSDRSWVTQAACRDLPSRQVLVFVPDESDRKTRAALTREAKAVCAGCPVVDACLAYALENNIIDGVWGNTTPRARRAMGSGVLASTGDLSTALDDTNNDADTDETDDTVDDTDDDTDGGSGEDGEAAR